MIPKVGAGYLLYRGVHNAYRYVCGATSSDTLLYLDALISSPPPAEAGILLKRRKGRIEINLYLQLTKDSYIVGVELGWRGQEQ